MKDKDWSAGLENGIATEIMHVYRRLSQRGAQAMEKLNIGVGQLPILRLLSENETMTQRQIAEETRVTPATVCGTLKRMEKSGLIRRSTAAEDGRVSCVSLTDEGRARSRQAMKLIVQPYGEMLRGFSDEERFQLKEYIRRMGENLTGAADEDKE